MTPGEVWHLGRPDGGRIVLVLRFAAPRTCYDCLVLDGAGVGTVKKWQRAAFLYNLERRIA